MKKILLFALLGIALLAGCGRSRYDENIVIASDSSKMKIDVNGWTTCMDIGRIEYDGHTYIVFNGERILNGIVHDPDCKCHKTTINEPDTISKLNCKP